MSSSPQPGDPAETSAEKPTGAAKSGTDDERPRGRNLKPLRQLLPFVLAYPGQLAAFAFFLVLAAVLTLVLPAAFRLVVDCGFGGASQAVVCNNFALGTDLSGYFMLGMAVAFLSGLAGALRFYFISRLGERVIADTRRRVYDHLLTLSPRFFEQAQTGEVVSRLTTDTTLIQTVVGSSVSVAIRTVATTLGALVLMVIVSWKLALMVLAVGPFVLLPVTYFGRRVQRLSRDSQDSLARASARASESLRAIETVQAFTREREEARAFASAVEDTFAVSLKRIRVRALMTALIFSVILTALISVLWYGAVQVQQGAITPGAMTQFVMYAFVAVSGVGLLTETYAEIMRAAGATERLMEILGTRSEIDTPQVPSRLPVPAQGAVSFRNVSFAYPGRPDRPAITDVSLTVEPGQTVALVGPSGAGKSTLFKLLLRLYDPQSGVVFVDGQDVRSLDPEALRGSMALVQQEAPLFSGPVFENIRFGRPDADEQEVRAAAEAANAAVFIDALPQGYATTLGEGGSTLSGGQRQRIAIARAILRDAPILLLDEATSALDAESERAIQHAVEEISTGRTTLVIAHRMATIRRADNIVVMDEGRIVDQGTHHELLARGGIYARYIALQFGAAEQQAQSLKA
ncbi:MAG: ABC transporter transmembrane domain-containing protein [Pseudomonadota bacterium]